MTVPDRFLLSPEAPSPPGRLTAYLALELAVATAGPPAAGDARGSFLKRLAGR